MTHATQPKPAEERTPRRPAVWTDEDLAILARLQADSTRTLTPFAGIRPAQIKAVVDELFPPAPGRKGCGDSKAYRIKDLMIAVASGELAIPEGAPVLRAPTSAPEALPSDSPAEHTPEPEPSGDDTPESQPETPEPKQPGALRRATQSLRAQLQRPEAEPETGEVPELRYVKLRRIAAGAGVVAVAGVAAWISYSHQVTLAKANGQHGDLAKAWPLAVDGLVLSCGILVAVDRLRGFKPRAWAFLGFWLGVAASVACNALAGDGGWLGRALSAFPAIALLIAVEALTTGPKRRAKKTPKNA